MFVEGLIDKDYLDILIAWGHEPDWVIDNKEEAIKKGYDGYHPDSTLGHNKVITRIWVDSNMEDFFPPEDMVKDDKGLLGLMAVSKNKKLREFAERMLKDGMAEEE